MSGSESVEDVGGRAEVREVTEGIGHEVLELGEEAGDDELWGSKKERGCMVRGWYEVLGSSDYRKKQVGEQVATEGDIIGDLGGSGALPAST